MTPSDLASLIAEYQAGVDAELRLLKQLDQVAVEQRTVTITRNFDAFQGATDARNRLTQSLVNIEDGLRPVRLLLSEQRRAAQALPGYDRVVALHREASELVSKILTTDRDSFRALADAELARRAALSSLEQGEMTLAAYRKVLAPSGHATLVDARG